jgi:hypothetical protein
MKNKIINSAYSALRSVPSIPAKHSKRRRKLKPEHEIHILAYGNF